MLQDSIQKTKEGFEKSFAEGSLYNKQTQDEKHVDRMLELMQIEKKSTILDLGTGSGYLAFTIARRYPACSVIGLDIVEKTLEANREKAKEQGLDNIEFVSYDGMKFPFEADKFDFAVTRYALHHFPAIQDSFYEINRVMKSNGRFLVTDPTPNEDDTTRFVDDYMRMKADGHIKYYSKEEFQEIAYKAGFSLTSFFDSEITFPRLKETATGFDDIMKKHAGSIIEGYGVHVTEDGKYIYTTQKVLNLLFQKEKQK